MRQRRYAVDDCDYEDYKRSGGTMSMAEFFNARLGSSHALTDSLSDRLANALYEARAEPLSLTERIKSQL